MSWLLVLIQAVISGFGVLALRYAGQRFTGISTTSFSTLLVGAAGAVLYAVSFLMWIYILSKTPATYAFPLTIGISLLVTTVGAVLLFQEKITLLHGFGIGLLIVAVVLIGSFGKSS